jgi:tRNA (cmo5U34)-methyltransferase
MARDGKEIALHVGENIQADNASWTFSGGVAETFTDHVRRSVPFYDEAHDLGLQLSDFFLKDGSTCYELGVSTGVFLGKLARRHSKKSIRFVGIDREEDMIKQAQKEIGALGHITLEVGDINLYDYDPADMIASYYTICFVPPRLRQNLFNKIYESLNWGGAFLMFEKVRAGDARFQDMMTSLYTDFKLESGYHPDEIVAKARSLKGVMEPFSTQGNIEMLRRAGFVDYMTVMKYVCFEGFLAIK